MPNGVFPVPEFRSTPTHATRVRRSYTARWRGSRLDQELARGADPATSPELERRAPSCALPRSARGSPIGPSRSWATPAGGWGRSGWRPGFGRTQSTTAHGLSCSSPTRPCRPRVGARPCRCGPAAIRAGGRDRARRARALPGCAARHATKRRSSLARASRDGHRRRATPPRRVEHGQHGHGSSSDRTADTGAALHSPRTPTTARPGKPSVRPSPGPVPRDDRSSSHGRARAIGGPISSGVTPGAPTTATSPRDRPLGDDSVERQALSPEAPVCSGQFAVVGGLSGNGAGHGRDLGGRRLRRRCGRAPIGPGAANHRT